MGNQQSTKTCKLEIEVIKLRKKLERETRRTQENEANTQANILRAVRSEFEAKEQAARKQQEELQKNIEENMEMMRLQRLKTVLEPIKPSKIGNIFLNEVISSSHTTSWSRINRNAVLKYHSLPKHCQEFKEILTLFKVSNKSSNYVDNIERIENHYLMSAYLLKREEYRNRYGGNFQEELLFHGTKKQNVYSICMNNFDWRRNGENRRRCYGQGVAFTSISFYATHSTDKMEESKVIIVAKVLLGKIFQSANTLIIPPVGYDTTQINKGKDFIKFDDNEFYPAYVITYHERPCNKTN